MSFIGTFTRQNDQLVGDIRSLTLRTKVWIRPVAKTSDNAPDLRIFANGIEIGAGWTVLSKSTNQPYGSCQLDDPTFPAPIYARLIESEKGHLLMWSR
jgi:uncharacterized protein (DUF736 family)